MVHVLKLCLLGVLVVTFDALPVYAQTVSHNFPLGGRGPGFYFSIWKIGLAWGLFALWVKTSDWVSQDCLRMGWNYALWNPIVVFTFAAAFALFFFIPWYWAGLALMVVAYLAPLITYIVWRNERVQLHQKVLSRSHIRHLWADFVGKLGVKVDPDAKPAADKGPPINFTPMGAANDTDNRANLGLARQSPGFVTAKELVEDMIERRGDAAMLEFTTQNVSQKLMIDGVWHDLPTRERAEADPMLAVLKKIAGRNETERRAKQEGKFGVEYRGRKLDARIVTQGVETGERAIVSLEDKKMPFKSFEELGMRQKLIEQLKEVQGQAKGLIVYSTPPQGGLSTLFYAAVRECDRYMRDFVSIEDAARPEKEVENVHVHTYDSTKRETPMKVLPEVARSYPNAYAVREPTNAETLKFLLEQIPEDRLVLTTVRAKECVEAILRVLMLKVQAKDIAGAITAVVNMRLVRRLCDACKEAYAPPPEVVRQLAAVGAKVEALHRPPQPIPGEKPKPPCKTCSGIGYLGRVGIFEVLIVGDNTRLALVQSPKIETLRTAARKDGMRTLQEEGLLLVVKGITSLQELLRVLKQ
jgi:type II secretory ATPase GspE/PulE/Tfp pilus assembly ATPase PilB-like protein